MRGVRGVTTTTTMTTMGRNQTRAGQVSTSVPSACVTEATPATVNNLRIGCARPFRRRSAGVGERERRGPGAKMAAAEVLVACECPETAASGRARRALEARGEPSSLADDRAASALRRESAKKERAPWRSSR